MTFTEQRKFVVVGCLVVAGISMAFALNGCAPTTTITKLPVTSSGPAGPTGPQGPAGPQGPTGATGPSGANGVSIVSTAIPDISGSCANGGNVIMMAQDTDNTGAWEPDDNDQTSILVCNGATGAQGPAGTTGLSVVKFCSAYTTVYPTTFPEYGLCISGSIYAVYWDNTNAWLAEVVPGSYQSTSTSAPCDFTVSANCEITN